MPGYTPRWGRRGTERWPPPRSCYTHIGFPNAHAHASSALLDHRQPIHSVLCMDGPRTAYAPAARCPEWCRQQLARKYNRVLCGSVVIASSTTLATDMDVHVCTGTNHPCWCSRSVRQCTQHPCSRTVLDDVGRAGRYRCISRRDIHCGSIAQLGQIQTAAPNKSLHRTLGNVAKIRDHNRLFRVAGMHQASRSAGELSRSATFTENMCITSLRAAGSHRTMIDRCAMVGTSALPCMP